VNGLEFLKACAETVRAEIAKDMSPKRESLEWKDPSLECTRHIPNQYVDEEGLPSFSHAGDDLEIIIGNKDVQTDSLDTLISNTLNPKF